MLVNWANDVGVGQVAGDPGFVEEALAGLRISQQMGQQNLECHFLAADAVEGGEDCAHAAGTQRGPDLESLGQNATGGEAQLAGGVLSAGGRCGDRSGDGRGGAGRSSCLVRRWKVRPGGTAFSKGVTAADYDGDGYVDFYVSNLIPNFLYHNNGNLTFTEVARQAGVAGSAKLRHLVFRLRQRRLAGPVCRQFQPRLRKT